LLCCLSGPGTTFSTTVTLANKDLQFLRVPQGKPVRSIFVQVEIHPHWRNDELREYCESEKIHVSAYCPLGTPSTSAKAVIRRAQSVSSVSTH